MNAKHVALIPGNRKELRPVTRALRAVTPNLTVVDRLSELPTDRHFDLLLADYTVLEDEDRRELQGKRERNFSDLLLLSDGELKTDLVSLFESRSLTNLVARKTEVDPYDLIVTVQKLLRGQIFGMEKYFNWGVQPLQVTIRGSRNKAELLEAARDFARGIGVNSRLVELYCSVADEFVTNAVFNAPVDADGRFRFAHRSREESVELEPAEAVEVRLCSDGVRLGISVSDPFGSLSRDRLLQYLAKCFRKGDDQIDDKAGGAGLGLYFIFEWLNHFIVNIAPGQRTEMIGLMDVRGGFREFAAGKKSFNIFMTQP